MHRVKVSESLDKIVLAIAMVVFAWVGWLALGEARYLDTIAGQDRPLLSEMMLNAPRFKAEAPDVVATTWAPPQSQSRGGDWVFDTFTPPVIYYDPTSKAFAVTPPNLKTKSDSPLLWELFDLQLLEVRPRAYRLQLVGYAGEPGNYLAYLESDELDELMVVKEGERVPELGIRLLSFEEKKVQVDQHDSMPVSQKIGFARLFDERTSQEVNLTNQETKRFAELEAKVRLRSTGQVFILQDGGGIQLEDGDYSISELSLTPATALVSKFSKDGSRSLDKTLTPIETGTGRSGSLEFPSSKKQEPLGAPEPMPKR